MKIAQNFNQAELNKLFATFADLHKKTSMSMRIGILYAECALQGEILSSSQRSSAVATIQRLLQVAQLEAAERKLLTRVREGLCSC